MRDITQPPKMSPLALVSPGIAVMRTDKAPRGSSLSAWRSRAGLLIVVLQNRRPTDDGVAAGGKQAAHLLAAKASGEPGRRRRPLPRPQHQPADHAEVDEVPGEAVQEGDAVGPEIVE